MYYVLCTMYYSYRFNCLFLIKFQFCEFSQNSFKKPFKNPIS